MTTRRDTIVLLDGFFARNAGVEDNRRCSRLSSHGLLFSELQSPHVANSLSRKTAGRCRMNFRWRVCCLLGTLFFLPFHALAGETVQLAQSANSGLERSSAAATLDRSPNSKFYQPVLSFGDASANTKIYFFWSAVSAKSLQFFRTRIIPVALKKEKARAQIIVYQLLDNASHDLVGPGAYLLCPDSHARYAALATRYLANATDVSAVRLDKKINMYANAFVRRLISEKAINPAACLGSSDFSTRQVLQMKDTREFYAKYKFSAFPFLLIDGTYYAADDPEAVKLLSDLGAAAPSR